MPEKTLSVYLALAPLLLIIGTACLSSVVETKLKGSSPYSFCLPQGGLLAALATAAYLFFRLKTGLEFSYWQDMLHLDRSSVFLTILVAILTFLELRTYFNQDKASCPNLSVLLFSCSGLIIALHSRELLSFTIGIGIAFWPLLSFMKMQLKSYSPQANLSLAKAVRLKIISLFCLFYGMSITLILQQTTSLAQISFSTEPLFIGAMLTVMVGLSIEIYLACFLMYITYKNVSTFTYRIKFASIGLILAILLFITRFFNLLIFVH